MIVVLSEFCGTPRVLRMEPRELIELAARLQGREPDGPAATRRERTEFAAAWARLRAIRHHARHFPNLNAALHFYRFGNHGLRRAEAAHVVRELLRARAADSARDRSEAAS